MKWGTDLADRERVKCYVESSPAGYPLCRKCGFEDVAEMEIELNRYKKKGSSHGQYRYKHIVMIRAPEVQSPPPPPPKVPPKDGDPRHPVSASKGSPIGYWDFGVAEEEGEDESMGNDGGGSGSDEDRPSAESGRDRRYGVVGAMGGGMEHSEPPFRATSQYGVFDTVSEGGGDDDYDDDDDDDGVVSRRTSRFEPGNGEAPPRRVSLI